VQIGELEKTLAAMVKSIQIVVENPVEHVEDEDQCKEVEYSLEHKQDNIALLHGGFKDVEEQVDDGKNRTSAGQWLVFLPRGLCHNAEGPSFPGCTHMMLLKIDSKRDLEGTLLTAGSRFGRLMKHEATRNTRQAMRVITSNASATVGATCLSLHMYRM